MSKRELRRKLGTSVAALATLAAVSVAACFFFYPAVVLLRLTTDAEVLNSAQPQQLPAWFKATAQRYRGWAEGYLQTQHAAHVTTSDVAGTEWPLFGTVFFLLSAEQLLSEGKIELDSELSAALEVAADVVVDPATATWVRKQWGEDYLTRENVFYRMLVIHGLTSFERATGNMQHHATQQFQARSLLAELTAAPYNLADDYPGQCYPVDVLWAAVALKRALGEEATPLVRQLVNNLDGQLRTKYGVPAFNVNSRSAQIYETSRGSGNSGLLSFAAELDPATAQRWYTAYTEHHWSSGFVSGFREVPHGEADVVDVDSGPVLLGLGSVASLFGIGAARANGHLEHAVPLSLQVLAVAWPTPFGLLVPGTMGWLAADGWCFGELALSFALTRPLYTESTTRHDGSIPPLVWLMTGFYFAGGVLIFVREATYWRARLRRSKEPSRVAQAT